MLENIADRLLHYWQSLIDFIKTGLLFLNENYRLVLTIIDISIFLAILSLILIRQMQEKHSRKYSRIARNMLYIEVKELERAFLQKYEEIDSFLVSLEKANDFEAREKYREELEKQIRTKLSSKVGIKEKSLLLEAEIRNMKRTLALKTKSDLILDYSSSPCIIENKVFQRIETIVALFKDSRYLSRNEKKQIQTFIDHFREGISFEERAPEASMRADYVNKMYQSISDLKTALESKMKISKIKRKQ